MMMGWRASAWAWLEPSAGGGGAFGDVHACGQIWR